MKEQKPTYNKRNSEFNINKRKERHPGQHSLKLWVKIPLSQLIGRKHQQIDEELFRWTPPRTIQLINKKFFRQLINNTT